ncbi:MAG: HNH endonuclease [Clostridia bacterium]|nr:HNH endonuclease [Clostridia bacterium]
MNYLDAIIDALIHLGGEANQKDICNYIENHNTLDYIKTNRNWRNQVSNAITTHSSDAKSYEGKSDLFYSVHGLGNGTWGLRNNNFSGLDEYNLDSKKEFKEGSVKSVLVNAYERNPKARKECIEYYKKKNGRLFCEICRFDFGKFYGEKFEDKIHIHHLTEISTIGKEYKINPIKDLIPICANCHMIVHNKKPAYKPNEIKEMIKKAEKK